MGNKRLRPLVKYDVTVGMRQNLVKYGIGFFLLVFLCGMTIISCKISGEPMSFRSCFTAFFRGIPKYVPGGQNEFSLPVTWLLYHLYALFMVCSYPNNDLEGYGKSVLLSSGSRFGWWLSKCLWTVISEVAFWAVTLLLLLFAGAPATASPPIGIGTLLLPLAVLISLSLLQMALSFLINPTISFFFSVVLLVITAYCDSPLLIGNYDMMARVLDGNASVPLGFALAAILSITAVVAGFLLWRKKDILQQKQEG